MTWLYKRGKFWHYRFNHAGVDYSGSTRATDKATATLVLEEARRQAILMGIGMAKATTLETIVGLWTKAKASSSPSHLLNSRRASKALGDILKLPADRITTSAVQEWASNYTKTHAATTANLFLSMLSLWLRWAVRDKLLREMPCEIRPLRVQERRRPVVTDWRAFLDTVEAGCRSKQTRPALAMMMLLGIRIGELVQARWEWIEDGIFVVGGRTKSKRIRRVPIPEPLMHELRAYAGEELPKLGLIFPDKNGKQHTTAWLYGPIRKQGLTPHRLRATFATLHLRAKTNPKDVQEMLGHSNIRTTMAYSEGSQEEKRKRQEELWA